MALSEDWLDVLQLVGSRIREHRKEKGWAQEDLARHADLRLQTISRMELGLRLASPDSFQKVARALGVSVRDLFEGLDFGPAPLREVGGADSSTGDEGSISGYLNEDVGLLVA